MWRVKKMWCWSTAPLGTQFGKSSVRTPCLPPTLGDGSKRDEVEFAHTDYVYAFELAAVLLLVAIVAAIVLTLRRRPTTLYQSPSRQVRVTKEERLRVVQMPSESRDNKNQGDPS